MTYFPGRVYCVTLHHCSGHAQLCNSCMHGVQLAPVRRTWMACLLGSVNVQRACTTCDPCKHCIKNTTWTQSKQILISQSACISFYPHNEKCQTQTNCTLHSATKLRCKFLLDWCSWSTAIAGSRWCCSVSSTAAVCCSSSSSSIIIWAISDIRVIITLTLHTAHRHRQHHLHYITTAPRVYNIPVPNICWMFLNEWVIQHHQRKQNLKWQKWYYCT